MRVGPWSLAALGLSAFGLLVWFGGPLVSVGGSAPLAAPTTRIVLIAVFVLQYLLQKGWAAWRAKRRNAYVVGQLASPASGAESAELAQLRKRFAAAVATLKNTRFGTRGGTWSSLSWKFGRQYLYQLPWYVIIGAPGAGKTTALLNAGLQFPLAGEFGRGAIKGVGGTRNCDWWFTDRAVLLDTAGRYTTHEADRLADRRAWEGFLVLLARARPRQPLNGVLVAVSVNDLLAFDKVQRAQHAATLRARLDELRAAVGIRIPIYLLLTKCDLLPGFLDSFLAFDKRERDQVWGTTFDFADSDAGRAVDQFPAAFEQLAERLHDGLVERMQGERDPQRRARIFSLPRQFTCLGAALNELVRNTFGPGPSSVRHGPACLRGIYFTSGTQEGTPIDRTLSALGRELGVERQILPPNQSTGKSFFLANVLRDVVFAEAEMAGRSPRWQRWRTRAITMTLATMQAAGVLLAAYWVTGYTRSSSEVAQIGREAVAARAQIDASDARPGTDPRPLLPALDSLTELIRKASPDSKQPGAAVSGFRSHQRLKLAAAAHQAYERMLTEALLVRIVQRCEEQMRSGADPNLQYEALKAYTMLHQPAHFDAASLKAFVTYEWDTALEPPLAGQDRARLVRHLDALLDAGATGAAATVDARLLESVRSRLAGQSIPQRVATRLKAILGARNYPEFSVASLDSSAAGLLVGKDGHSAPRSVPGRFSQQAYRDGVLGTLPTLATQLAAESSWVLASSPPAGAARASDSAGTGTEALAMYLEDYGAAWADLLDDVRLKRAAGPADSMRQAQTLSARDSPLAELLQAVVQQTSLQSEPVPGIAAQPLEQAIARRFAAVRELITQSSGGRRPFDTVLADFNELRMLRALQGPDSARDDVDEAVLERFERIRIDSRHFPEPVQSILLAAAASPAPTKSARTAAPAGAASNATLADACGQAVAGRFPFDRGSEREIAMADFNRLFAPSGMMDGASAARIRDVFFAGNRPEAGLRLTFRPHDMDETIERFVLEIDGQQVSYAHGPVTATVVTWPGPTPGARVQMTPAPAGQPALEIGGTWALFRLFDRVAVESIKPGRFRIVFNLGGRRASFDVEAESGANPFRMPELERFECPTRS